MGDHKREINKYRYRIQNKWVYINSEYIPNKKWISAEEWRKNRIWDIQQKEEYELDVDEEDDVGAKSEVVDGGCKFEVVDDREDVDTVDGLCDVDGNCCLMFSGV